MSSKISLVHGIAIDTNVFVHLFNPKNNTCDHIGKLLTTLASKEIALIVDTGGRIEYEYDDRNVENRLTRLIDQKASDDSYQPILKYWFVADEKTRVEVNFEDDLMSAIKEIIDGDEENDKTDRVFVYVAMKKGSVLVTNDRKDMIDEEKNDGKRREKILGVASDMGAEYRHVKVWVSQEAYDAMIRSAGGEYELNENQVEWKSPTV